MNGNFLKSVVTSKNELPNKVVLDSFHNRFADAHNVEWSHEGEVFEALFSETGFEKIAKIHFSGEILEVRTNVKPESIVAPLAHKLKKHGTIMNVIHIENHEAGETFEFIIKDEWKVRHLFVTDCTGNVLTHRNFDDLI